MIRTTEIYDIYWSFAAERQRIFFKRLTGETNNVSNDPILKAHRFTNAYRASDRVSQYLIRNVIYANSQSPESVFFRTILFRTFNRISTWERLSANFGGSIDYKDYSFSLYDKVLSSLLQSGAKVYSAAYIMPSGKREFGHTRKHQNNLRLIERMMQDSVPAKIAGCGNLEYVFRLLRSYPTVGDFLAYQYAVDLAYSALDCGSESDFVIPGPGALRGIKKCIHDPGNLKPSDLIKYVAERQHDEFRFRGIEFDSLYGRSLQLIDCQNLFCEIDKYARVFKPDLAVGGRVRIKQNFVASSAEIKLFYPPKWGINEHIPHEFRARPPS